jgi:cysteine synthase A
MNTLYQKQTDLVGSTPILKIESLSKLAGSNIFVKCENLHPGGSIKDRAAKQIVLDAIDDKKLKPGMTIVEGTAGNTGIGLAIAAKSFGLDLLAVMPKGQTPEKERMIELFGGSLKLVDPCPFANENHFYHTARRLSEETPEKYFWANQFENLSNYRAHYLNTAPEILKAFGDDLDYFVSVAGTGGTIGGNTDYIKKHSPRTKTYLADPHGSGLYSFFKTGEFKSEGSSFSEGIGIMRLVENFKKAKVDEALCISDQAAYYVSRYVQEHDGIILGTSSAINVAAAFKIAKSANKGSNILTMLCDLGERSYSKLFNEEFLKSKGIELEGSIKDYSY